MTSLVDRLRAAKRLLVPQHAVDQYLKRSRLEPKPAGYVITELVVAEYMAGQHRNVLDEGFPRTLVLWTSEPLVSVVRPDSKEGGPVVLTVINFEMYQASLSTKRYVANDDTQVAADAKAENDFRSQLGELKSRLKKIREALGVETDAIALRVVRQLAAHRAVQPVVERSST